MARWNGWILVTVFAVGLAGAGQAAGADDRWTPGDWIHEETLELGTTAPGEDTYWFKVWLVVIDGDLYVRLGSTAAERVEESTSKPYMRVKIAGVDFPKVEGVPEPDEAERVSKLMAEKYWTDVFVAWLPILSP